MWWSDRKYLFANGPRGRSAADGVLHDQACGRRPHQGDGRRAGAAQYSRECCCAYVHRYADDGAVFGQTRISRMGYVENSIGTPGDAGGGGCGGGFSRITCVVAHHRREPHGRRWMDRTIRCATQTSTPEAKMRWSKKISRPLGLCRLTKKPGNRFSRFSVIARRNKCNVANSWRS